MRSPLTNTPYQPLAGNRYGRWLTLLGLLLLALLVGYWWLERQPTAVEQETAVWLTHHTPPDATLFAPAAVGRAAGRTTLPTPSYNQTQAQLAATLADLITADPDFLLLNGRLLPHQALAQTGWLQQHYTPTHTIPPLTIWQRTTTPFDSGTTQTADLLVNDQISLTSYRVNSRRLIPGDPIYLTLHLQATRPISRAFQTNVNLVAAHDKQVWAWQRLTAPQAVPGGWWQVGQTIPEQLTIATTPDLPPAAYEIQLFFHPANDEARWPLRQNADGSIHDRVRLGYLLLPPENVDSSGATPLNARFGDTITLVSARVTGTVEPAATLMVTLFWQATGPVTDNLTVFVHLLNEAGELVANHDSRPENGRFPTQSWLPDQPIPDNHPLTLPSTLPPGPHTLLVGLYHPDSGQRLPATDANSQPIPNNALPLPFP